MLLVSAPTILVRAPIILVRVCTTWKGAILVRGPMPLVRDLMIFITVVVEKYKMNRFCCVN